MPTRALTICPRCTTRHTTGQRCPTCTARRGTTSQRGYGPSHQQLRAQLAPHVATGDVTCWRCHHLIASDEAWDLGHDDNDKRLYKGPEHVDCNRGTALRR